MGAIANRRRYMGEKKSKYLQFEDQEVWRLCCITWGDYNQIVVTDNGNDTVNITTTFISKLNTTTVESRVVSTQTNVDNTGGTYTAGTTKEPVGITKTQCEAVGDVRNQLCTSSGLFRGNTNIIKLNDLRYFTNAYASSNSAVSLFNTTMVEELTGNGILAFDVYNCPNLKWAKNISGTLIMRFARSANVEYFTTPYGKNTFGESLINLSVSSSFVERGTKIEYVVFLGTTPSNVRSNLFHNSTFPIYVPDESVETYKATSPWSSWASRIKPISQKSTDFPDE